ncbi:hypothetical protein SVIOM74S_02305 [Streptomyces violarus]
MSSAALRAPWMACEFMVRAMTTLSGRASVQILAPSEKPVRLSIRM